MILGVILFVVQSAVTPPAQPFTGPGSAATSLKVIKSSHGEGAKSYWLFEPEAARRAPVIAFLHGWTAVEPEAYGAWIEHLVQRGNIVIYPAYQEGALERVPNMSPNAIEAVRNAFTTLGQRVDRNRFAVVGHSLGGVLAFNLAAQADSSGLPRPKALMAVEPGDTDSPGSRTRRAKLVREGTDYRRIPANVEALVVVGDEDTVVGDKTAKTLFDALRHVPCANKNFVTVRSDRHGKPELVADHFAPATAVPAREPGPLRRLLRSVLLKDEPKVQVDALDYYGFWKLLDALTDSAFFGRNKDYALGGGRNQVYMGEWSDGTPVRPLLVTNDAACKGGR